MPNFFSAPLLPQQPNPEPGGWPAIRAMLASNIFQRQANPYGLNPNASSNAAYNPLLPSGGQGRFNPYGGGYGVPQQGGGMPGGGGFGGGNQNQMMQMFMQFMKQRQMQGAPGGRVPGQVPFRGAPPSGPAAGGMATPPMGESPNQYSPMGQFQPPSSSIGQPGGGVSAQPVTEVPGGGGTVGNVPDRPGDPYSQNLMDGNPVEQTEYDGRPDAAKMMHGHTALMRAVLPMLLKASAARHAAAGPPPPQMPMGGGPPPSGPAPSPTAFDGTVGVGGPGGSVATGSPGGAWTGMTALPQMGTTTPGPMPGFPQTPGGGAPGDFGPSDEPAQRPTGYDGDPSYGGFNQIRAPFSQPHPPMPMGGGASARHTASGLNRILGGMQGANRRGMIETARAGSPHSVFDGERNEYRPLPRGPAPSTDYDAATPDPNGGLGAGTGTGTMPPTSFDPGGSALPPSTSAPTAPAGNAGSTGSTGGYNPYPSGAETLGNPMYPWLMPYTGQRTAPLSNEQNQALGQMGGFVGSGEGLGTGYDYLSSELGGKYIGEADPYMQQIAQGAGNLKNIQDAQAKQRIASSMAAGGNALSGARSAAESQYQNTSDANYQQMLGQMKLQNLTNERNLQQGAAGMLPNYANTQVSGLNSLMNAGAVPQQTEQSDYNRQYNDWLRQIGAMQTADQFGQTQGLNLLKSGGYTGTNQPLYGESSAAGIAGLLAGLLGGGSSGSGLGGLLSKLLGGGGSSAKPGGGSSGGGGGTPGKDSSGKTPDQPGYDPTSDPGNAEYIAPGDNQNMQMPTGYDPFNDPAYNPGNYDTSGYDIFGGGPGNSSDAGLGGDPGSEGYGWAMDPNYGDTGGYYGDGSEGG